MSDQAESLRQRVMQASENGLRRSRQSGVLSRNAATIAPGSQQRGSIVLVAGVTQGVGATSLAIELGLRWKRQGVMTSLIDAHAARPTIGERCGVEYRSSWQDVLAGDKTLREACVTGPSGLPIVACGGANPHDVQRQTTNQSCLSPEHPAMGQLVHFSKNQRVIIDVGETNRVGAYLPIADHCILVCGDAEDAMLECYAAIKSAASVVHRAAFWLVCNGVADMKRTSQCASRLQITCDQCLNLELRLAGLVPLGSLGLGEGDERSRRGDESAPADVIQRIANRLSTRMVSQQAVALAEV